MTTLLRASNSLATSAGPRDAFLMAAVETLAGTLWIWRLPQQQGNKAQGSVAREPSWRPVR